MGVRSLFAGVSGLRNFQQQLDIIGNNIANSQTAGYKSSRVTFQDLLSQTTRGAVAPGLNTGGVNPLQFGLGAGIGAIDINMNQGNLLTTGRQLDLAISGNGFFKVSDGTTNFYTRNGAFDIDQAGNLVSTNTGFIVQGFQATDGVLDLTSVGNIGIPVGVVLPAQATTTVSMVGNLDSSAQQTGSVLQTDTLLATELAADDNDMDGLYASGSLNSRIAGLQPGISTISVAATDGSGTAVSFSLTYVGTDAAASDGQFNSLEDLRQEIDNALTNNFAATIAANSGQITITHSDGGGTGSLVITSNNSSLQSALSGLTNIAYAAGGGTNTSDVFSHTATEADLLTNLRNSTGTSLGLQAADTIDINGDLGGNAITTSTFTVLGASTLASFNNQIQTAFSITNQSNNVEVNNGRVSITGDGGSNYAISNIDISTGGTRANFDGVFDSTSGNYATLQNAQDTHVTSFIAHDSDGAQHTVTIKLNIRDQSGGAGQWVFDIESTETATGVVETVSPSTGSISFSGDGSLLSFSPLQVQIQPAGIGNTIDLVLDPGTIAGFDGLVSFENESSARFSSITGYASGELQNISINQDGLITGNFTNGQTQTLAQLALALFDNPAGLEKAGNNNFLPTLNSGVPTDAPAGNGGRGILIPSALEGSNVDLAEEFVTLITAQRGFQTNARIITTADEILGELVNLVR